MKQTPYNLFNDIEETATKRKNKAAFIAGDNSISYAELLEAAKFAASAFKSCGIKDYAKCVLIGEDSSEYIFAALGIISCQGVFVSAGKEITNTRFNELLEKIAVDFAVLEESFGKKLLPEGYKKCKIVSIDDKNFCVFSRVKRTAINESFTKLNPAFIRFTSGTTGTSKGVVLSHQTIKERTEFANSALGITEKDRVLWLLPMAYHFAVTIMPFLRKGCTIDIAVDEPSKNVIAKLLNKKTTFVYATPYHYSKLINEFNDLKNKAKIANSVRLLITTAMPLNKELFAKFLKTFGRNLNQAYGIIECGLPCINLAPNQANALTVGKPLPGYQIRIAIKEHDESAGEIVIKGPGFFDAYFDPWEKSSSVLSNDCFFTGDMGRFEKDGTVRIIGRKKSVINFLGLKIFPEQVEQILLQHPAVAEARVFGEEHPDFGQIVVSEIVVAARKKVDEIELTKFCAASLSQQEIPQEFRMVDKIEKTDSGKTKR